MSILDKAKEKAEELVGVVKDRLDRDGHDNDIPRPGPTPR